MARHSCTAPAGASWSEVLLHCAGGCGHLPLPQLVRCIRVCRAWRADVKHVLATARLLEFCGCSAGVTGRDVEGLLCSMAGANLQALDLRGCHRLSADDLEGILVKAWRLCPSIRTIDLSECNEGLILRAIACDVLLHRRPQALYENLLACRAGAHARVQDRIPFEECYSETRLNFDIAFCPSTDALLDATLRDDRLVASLLLNVRFTDEQGGARAFSCNTVDRNGRRPLHFAAATGSESMVSLLIGAHSDINAADIQGSTPMLMACAAGSVGAATLLLEASADSRHSATSGNTPLLAACEAGSAEIVEILLAKGGAEIEAIRADNASALSLAVASGHEELSKLLTGRLVGRFRDVAVRCEDTRDACLVNLTQLYTQDGNVDAWLASGTPARAIVGELGALIACDQQQAVKEKLTCMRATLVNIAVEEQSLFSVPLSHGAGRAPSTLLHTITATDGVQSVAFSPDGSTIARAEGRFVVICDAVTGFERWRETGSPDYVRSVSFCHDGKILASASNDKTVRLWAMARSGSARFRCVELTHHNDWVYAVAFSPKKNVLASGGREESVFLSSQGSEHCSPELTALEGHKSRVTSLSWSPDGDMLASASADNCVKIWDTNTNRELRTLEGHTSKISCVAVSLKPLGAGGSLLVASGSFDNTLRVWEMSTGACIRLLVGHMWAISCVAFSPCDPIVASGSWDKSIRIWNVSSGECLHVLEGHAGVVTSLIFSPDGKTLISASEDKTLSFWNAEALCCTLISS